MTGAENAGTGLQKSQGHVLRMPAQGRRGRCPAFHSGLNPRPGNDDSWKFATTSGKLRKTLQLLWCRGQTGLIPLTNRASGPARGSSFVRNWNRSLSLTVIIRSHFCERQNDGEARAGARACVMFKSWRRPSKRIEPFSGRWTGFARSFCSSARSARSREREDRNCGARRSDSFPGQAAYFTRSFTRVASAG